MRRSARLGRAALGGVLALGWTYGPLARAAPPSSLQVKVGQNRDMSHIELTWAGGATYTAERQGQTLTLHFSRDADPDLAGLNVDPPAYLQTAVVSHPGGRLDLTLTLKPGADAKTGQADGAIYVNLFRAPATSETTAMPVSADRGPRPDPRPASGVVRMSGEIVSGQIRLHFPWRAPLGAAAFRRGDAVWLVFDTEAKLDVRSAPPQTPAFKGLRVVNGPGFSAIRVLSPGGSPIRAWADGPVWSLAIGSGDQPAPALLTPVRDKDAQLGVLKTSLAGATKAVWVDDPAVGDRIGVVTALAPAKALAGRRDYVDLALLPTAQGLAFEPIAQDISVTFDSDWVSLSRPKGLSLSIATRQTPAQAADLDLPRPASMPALINFADWSQAGAQGFVARYDGLQSQVAAEISGEADAKHASVKARMGLARFLAGCNLAYEAIGILNLTAKAHPEVMNDPEFRGLRGAARAMVGRYQEAANDFSVPFLAADPASDLWRGYIASKTGDWTGAREAFSAGGRALNLFPADWQARFARAYGEAALQLGQLDVASTESALAMAQAGDPREKQAALLLQARVTEAQGFGARALALYDQVSRSPYDGVAAPALLHATQLRQAKGQISVAQAAQTYDSLRFRWRGDGTELEALRSLGQLYLSQGHYREALETLKSAGGHYGSGPQALALAADLNRAFRGLFLDGLADGMQPVQALALFYDFKDLTPIGADGDLMVRKLAKRLVDVDLLDQASDLLKYQVDNRLDGVAKAQVATDLALLDLMNRKPEAAIGALNSSRSSLLPVALASQRRMIEARAWLALNQTDHALELVGKDTSSDADDIRGEAAWRGHEWPVVAALMEKQLGDRWKANTPLTPEDEARLLRAGVAYSLAGNEAALDRLRSHYQAVIDKAAAPDALRVALAGTASFNANPADFSKVAAEDDLFGSWVNRMKQHFRDEPLKG